MNLNRMKKSILLLLLVIPTLTKAQNVMTETRRELTSPDGAYRFTFYQRSFGEDNGQESVPAPGRAVSVLPVPE